MRFAWISLVVLCSVGGVAEAKKKKPDQCTQRVARLEASMANIPTHIGFGPTPMTVELVTSEASTMVETRGAIFDLQNEVLAFEGRMVTGGLEALDAQLDKIDEIEAMFQAKNAPVFVRIDRRTPIVRALELMCTLSRKRTVNIVVANPKAAPPTYSPPAPAESVKTMIGRLMSQPDPARRAAMIAKQFEAAIAGCDALQSGISAVDVVSPAEKSRYLKRAVIDGVRACQCKGVDVDAIESLVILMSAPVSPASYAFEPRLPCGQKKPYGLSPADDFEKLVAAMLR